MSASCIRQPSIWQIIRLIFFYAIIRSSLAFPRFSTLPFLPDTIPISSPTYDSNVTRNFCHQKTCFSIFSLYTLPCLSNVTSFRRFLRAFLPSSLFSALILNFISAILSALIVQVDGTISRVTSVFRARRVQPNERNKVLRGFNEYRGYDTPTRRSCTRKTVGLKATSERV